MGREFFAVLPTWNLSPLPEKQNHLDNSILATFVARR